MPTTFTSVILFAPKEEKTIALGASLSQFELIKVFTVLDKEEAQQIINMSNRTIVVFDKTREDSVRLTASKTSERGLFRKYVVDWKVPVEEEKFFFASTGDKGLTTITTNQVPELIEKFELYLFGCVKALEKNIYKDVKVSAGKFGSFFFSHFVLMGREWKMTVSTHEKENDISGIIGKDWEVLISTLKKNAGSYKRATEEVLIKPYMQVVYPHFTDGKLRGLTLAHFPYNANVQSNLNLFYKFLETI
jgi:hypothetical protein